MSWGFTLFLLVFSCLIQKCFFHKGNEQRCRLGWDRRFFLAGNWWVEFGVRTRMMLVMMMIKMIPCSTLRYSGAETSKSIPMANSHSQWLKAMRSSRITARSRLEGRLPLLESMMGMVVQTRLATYLGGSSGISSVSAVVFSFQFIAFFFFFLSFWYQSCV